MQARRLLFAVVAVPLFAGTAAATPSAAASWPDDLAVRGEVTSATAHWTEDGSRIITTAVIRADDGSEVTVSQLGGHVGDVTMRLLPGPEPLVTGMIATAYVRASATGRGAMLDVVDDVAVEQPSDFVRTGPTARGHYAYWESGCVELLYDAAGTAEIAGDGEFAIMDDAVATWNTSTASCSYLNLVVTGHEDHEVGNDKINVIKFRDTSWCRPAIADDPARCYSHSAAGITTATYIDDATSSRDGAILDADVELNGVDFAISTGGVSLGTASCLADLGNTLTHELGHVQGLEHTCLAAGDPPRVDDQGNAVPECADTTDPKIVDATMYNFQTCGETKKSSLTADDINGICTIYPIAKDPGTCGPPGATAGCCDAGSTPGGPLLLGAATWLALMAFSRRRRAV